MYGEVIVAWALRVLGLCLPMQQDVRGLLCLRKRQGVGRSGLEAEGLSQHNTYAEDRGLSLVYNAKSNPIQSVQTSGFSSMPRYQANIPCATQNREEVLAAAKNVPFQK